MALEWCGFPLGLLIYCVGYALSTVQFTASILINDNGLSYHKDQLKYTHAALIALILPGYSLHHVFVFPKLKVLNLIYLCYAIFSLQVYNILKEVEESKLRCLISRLTHIGLDSNRLEANRLD